MDPRSSRGGPSSSWLPRTRGDGPYSSDVRRKKNRASPHTRGWTPLEHRPLTAVLGFPAHAGMDPRMASRAPRSGRLPRTRGDGPTTEGPGVAPPAASPHTRGWTAAEPEGRGGREGFPAHAGMDPGRSVTADPLRRLPRTTRGWTLSVRWRLGCSSGFPAHAGMDPDATGIQLTGATGFPAHAGMDLSPAAVEGASTRLPRTRGDGPTPIMGVGTAGGASPHTRGWTVFRHVLALQAQGFPAHAGMDPSLATTTTGPGRLPRTRGDGPDALLQQVL